MSLYNYLTNIIQSIKTSWESAHSSPEPIVLENELTRNGKELQKRILDFYLDKFKCAISKADIKNYERKVDLTMKIPNEAWNKMAQRGNLDAALIDAIYFISSWDGNLEDLII